VGRYIVRRMLINIPVLWLIVTLVFFATSVLPGDFVAQRIAASNPLGGQNQAEQIATVKKQLGINQPIGRRYVTYLWNTVHGDLGTSYRTRQSAFGQFRDALPYTLQLSVIQLIIGLLISLPIGIISAVKQDTMTDYILRVFAILGVAAPSFWVATLLLLYTVRYHLFTIDLLGQPLLWQHPAASFNLYIIPGLAGGIASGAGVMRLLRSQMLEVLRQDYIRTAWSKGLRQRAIIVRHALKNAMIPVLTIIGLTVASLISGNVVFEYLFGIPGIGGRILTAINARDVPVVQAFVLIISAFVVVVNLAVDVLYGWLDPRIQYS
jgi:peptide/nickel transport system permease protein